MCKTITITLTKEISEKINKHGVTEKADDLHFAYSWIDNYLHHRRSSRWAEGGGEGDPFSDPAKLDKFSNKKFSNFYPFAIRILLA